MTNFQPLLEACREGHLEIVDYLCKMYGNNISSQNMQVLLLLYLFHMTISDLLMHVL